MIFVAQLDGTAQCVVPDRVFRWSNNVVDLTLIAPYDNNSAVTVNIKRPDGEKEIVGFMDNVAAPSEFPIKGYNAWTMKLRSNVTQYVGRIGVSFDVTGKRTPVGTDGETVKNVTTTYQGYFTVEDNATSPPNLTPPTEDVYQLIVEHLVEIQESLNNIFAKDIIVAVTADANNIGGSGSVQNIGTDKPLYKINMDLRLPPGIPGYMFTANVAFAEIGSETTVKRAAVIPPPAAGQNLAGQTIISTGNNVLGYIKSDDGTEYITVQSIAALTPKMGITEDGNLVAYLNQKFN